MSNVYSIPPRLAGGDAPASGLSSVDEIVAELQAGRMVIVLDDEDRENEGDFIMAAEHATPEAVAFMIRHSSGILCTPMDDEQLARLELPQMVPNNDEAYRTAFTVSVDYRYGTTTGVSSSDRSITIKALADPKSTPADFARPGHIFPLRPRPGGVLVRAGHTEAAVDLCKLAGLRPVGVLCEVMNDDGTMARRPELEEFARKHNLKIGTIADLIRYRLRNERSVERVSEQNVQTEFGEFRLYAYEDRVQRSVHLALAHGVLDGSTPPLVRVHVADTLRDLLGVRGAPHAWTLRAALERIAHAGAGVVVILREQETAAELTEALRALGAADQKSDSVTTRAAATAARPVPHTTPPVGAGGQVLRTYGVGAQILKDLGVKRMRVLSAPKQMHGISAFGLEIDGYVAEGA
ncbi:MAG TPA: 3,4-dihydroxy-2-butanone-4-phosphate synthase [Steroidobacteraceae bacterium]|nr:3,4-dihydroxy-2-butanone-4-phosphate synthase [Steroidobacteraceae bacterium]